jgi:hypothetical protein
VKKTDPVTVLAILLWAAFRSQDRRAIARATSACLNWTPAGATTHTEPAELLATLALSLRERCSQGPLHLDAAEFHLLAHLAAP